MRGQSEPLEGVRVIEPDSVPEFFVTHLADFEIRAGLIRLAFSVDRHLVTGVAYAPFKAHPSIVRCRLVMPLDRERAMNREITDLIAEYRTTVM